MRKLLFAVLLAIILLAPHALGLGITPTKQLYDFEPSQVVKGTLTIINSDGKDQRLLITAQGELAQYVRLPAQIVEMKASEGTRTYSFEMHLPESFAKPGVHEGEIIVARLPDQEGSGAFMGTTIGVAMQLRVRVPYPGKYAETRLDVSGAGVGEDVTFVLPVSNLGNEDIQSAKAAIAIQSAANAPIASITTAEKAIPARKTDELVGAWTADVSPGVYLAEATVTYDEKTASATRSFAIGDLFIDVISADVKDFKLGGIAKITLTLQNKWSEKVNDVYAELFVYDGAGDLLYVSKSASVGLEGLGTGTLPVYWDTQGLPSGTYSAKVVLHYADKTTEKPLRLVVGSTSMEALIIGPTGQAISEEAGSLGGSPVNLFLIIQILFILGNVGLLVFLWRKFRKKP